MMDKELLAALAADHKKHQLNREDAKAFLKDLMAVCERHRVFLRSPDQTLSFTRIYSDSALRTKLIAQVNKQGICASAKIDYR
jgi:hypothetical protein